MALHEASTLLSARQTATHGEVRASGATLGSQGGRKLGREGSLVACRPSLALCASSVWSSAARACPGLRPGLEQLGHRGAPSGPASLPGAHGSGLVVWQTLAGAADGQRGARRSVATHGGASDGASRHARGRDHPGPWGHRADLEHRSGTHTRHRIRDRSSEAARRLALVRTGATRVKSAWLSASSPLASLPGLPAPQTSCDVRCPGVVHPRHRVHSVCGCAPRSPMGEAGAREQRSGGHPGRRRVQDGGRARGRAVAHGRSPSPHGLSSGASGRRDGTGVRRGGRGLVRGGQAA